MFGILFSKLGLFAVFALGAAFKDFSSVPTGHNSTETTLRRTTKNVSSIAEVIELAKTRGKSACALLRNKLSSKTNEEVMKLAKAYLETPDDVCTFIYTCRLHKKRDNECGPHVNHVGSCFPTTPAGKNATVSCPYYFQQVFYDTTKNATRLCEKTGTWATKAVYSECTQIKNKTVCFNRDLTNLTMEERLKVEEQCEIENYNIKMIMLVGKGLSLISLVISFMLFWMLKSIRCWRNIIHWNLVASFILRIVISLLYHSPFLVSYAQREGNSALCRIMATLFCYAQATNYFWMFVEGLYLHMMVVMAYSYDRIKLRVYNAIGWGLPVPLTLFWAILKYVYENENCWAAKDPKVVDYFFQIPIIILLLINAIILGNVVRILFTKLRSGYGSGGRAGGEAAQYTKAVKAAVFLFPLLGIIYILFFISPPDQVGRVAFLYFNTFLQSFQGFFVCLIYCFANNEIQRALMKKINHWKWQMRCPFCFWRKKEGFRRSGSNASLSRTNNTIVNVKQRDGKDICYVENSKGRQGSTGSSPLLQLEPQKEGSGFTTAAKNACQTQV